MELIGVIKKINPIQIFGSNFQKREFILITEERFPQTLNIELHALRTDLIEPFNPGDRVLVGINILGKEWTSFDGSVRYFNTVVAWKIVYYDI